MPQNSDIFQIRIPGPVQNRSRIFTLADSAVPNYRGQALQQKSGNDGLDAELCSATGLFLGVLARDVTGTGARVGSSIAEDQAFFDGPDGLLEKPYVSGGAVSLEIPEEILVQTNITEGSRYVVDSGTGQLNHTAIDALSLGDGLNFVGGKLRVAQTGQVAEYAFAGTVTKTSEAVTNDRAFLAVRKQFVVA